MEVRLTFWIQCCTLTVAYGAPPDDGHQIWPSGHLADWMVRVHDGPWSLVHAGLPERKKYEEIGGPGIRTQVLKRFAFAL